MIIAVEIGQLHMTKTTLRVKHSIRTLRQADYAISSNLYEELRDDVQPMYASRPDFISATVLLGAYSSRGAAPTNLAAADTRVTQRSLTEGRQILLPEVTRALRRSAAIESDASKAKSH
jgi:hypothetical protein